jgi:photosynthetic reaction center H subunit
MKNDELRNEGLVPLSSMKDYKVAKNNLDVLGWRVLGADGESLGIVKDLIVDPKALKTRYLSVVADRRHFNADKDQYLLVPIGVAALDKRGRKVFVSAIDAQSIGRYPVYPGGPIPADYEYAVRNTFAQPQRDTVPDTTGNHKTIIVGANDPQPTAPRPISDDFYNNDTYNEDRFYTSNQEMHSDSTDPGRDFDKADAKADLSGGDQRPKSVEDAIATIEKLESLRERGSITEEEFVLLKKRALNL